MKVEELKKTKTEKMPLFYWSLKIFILTIVLSLLFGIGSEYILSGAGLVVSIVLLLIFIIIHVVFDMLGVAVTSAKLEPFLIMTARGERGGAEATKLIKNAEKICSICCDIVGDVCSIMCGTIGAGFISLITSSQNFSTIFISALISGIVASVTVGAKAIGKALAVRYSNKIVFVAGKIIGFFKIKRK